MARKVWTMRAQRSAAAPIRVARVSNSVPSLSSASISALADDRGERIVELVADPGEQRAQAASFSDWSRASLRPAELLFGALAVGDVDMDAVHGMGDAVAAAGRGAQRVDPAHVAIGEDDAIFDLDRLLGEAVIIRRGKLRPVVGMDARAQGRRIERLVGLQRVDLARAVRIPDRAVVRIERPDADLGAVHGQLEPAADQHQLLVGLLARGDVEVDAVDRLELAVLVADRGAERVDPAVVPVAERDPEFHPERHVRIGAVAAARPAPPNRPGGYISRARGRRQGGCRDPEHGLGLLGAPQRSLVRIERPDAELGTLHGQLEPALDQLELLLDILRSVTSSRMPWIASGSPVSSSNAGAPSP